jgi:hypothetical protein
VRDFGEALLGLATDALGGGVGGEELGMLGFEAAEADHERVVLSVGDLGGVEYVVKVLVAAELVAEILDLRVGRE